MCFTPCFVGSQTCIIQAAATCCILLYVYDIIVKGATLQGRQVQTAVLEPMQSWMKRYDTAKVTTSAGHT